MLPLHRLISNSTHKTSAESMLAWSRTHPTFSSDIAKTCFRCLRSLCAKESVWIIWSSRPVKPPRRMRLNSYEGHLRVDFFFVKENSTSATACSTFSSALMHFIKSLVSISLSSMTGTPYGSINVSVPRSVPFAAKTHRIFVHYSDFGSNRVHIACNDIGPETGRLSECILTELDAS